VTKQAAEPVLPGIQTTQFTAEQWKSRAMYEEACKLSAQRALARAMDVLAEALFAAAYVRPDPVEDLTIERRAWPVDEVLPRATAAPDRYDPAVAEVHRSASTPLPS
jgi:hypothetical protein